MSTKQLSDKVLEFKNLLNNLNKVSQELVQLIDTPDSDNELIISDTPPNPNDLVYQLYLYPFINDDSADTKNKVTAFCKNIESALTKPEVVRIVKSVGGSIKTMSQAQLTELGVAFERACETLPHVGIDFKKPLTSKQT